MIFCFLPLFFYSGVQSHPLRPRFPWKLLRRVEEQAFRGLKRFRTPVLPPAVPGPQTRFTAPAAPVAPLKILDKKYVLPSLALPLDSKGFALGSGFVLRAASGKLYAVSSYHVIGSAGRPVAVRLFRPNGRAVDYYNLKVSAGGSFGINAPDVSLVELPAETAEFVRPLGVALNPPAPGSTLVMWGRPYDANGFELAKGLRVQSAHGMKIVLDRTKRIAFLEGMCGAPVLDEDGLVTGIYGGRGGGDEELFAIDARKSLSWLLKNYETGGYESYTFSVFGYPALELGRGESVGAITHKTPDGTILKVIYFPTYREPFDASRLENVFEDLRSGDVIEFDLYRGRNFSHFYSFKVP